MIVPYRESPNHPDAERIATPGHDSMILGTCESDLWWWDPAKAELDRQRAEYDERVSRRIRPGFYVGAEPAS